MREILCILWVYICYFYGIFFTYLVISLLNVGHILGLSLPYLGYMFIMFLAYLGIFRYIFEISSTIYWHSPPSLPPPLPSQKGFFHPLLQLSSLLSSVPPPLWLFSNNKKSPPPLSPPLSLLLLPPSPPPKGLFSKRERKH